MNKAVKRALELQDDLNRELREAKIAERTARIRRGWSDSPPDTEANRRRHGETLTRLQAAQDLVDAADKVIKQHRRTMKAERQAETPEQTQRRFMKLLSEREGRKAMTRVSLTEMERAMCRAMGVSEATFAKAKAKRLGLDDHPERVASASLTDTERAACRATGVSEATFAKAKAKRIERQAA